MLQPNINGPIHLAGDEDQGFSSTIDLRANAVGQAILVYHGRYAHPHAEKEVRCEIYQAGGELDVHTICVRCGEAQWVKGAQKKIEYDKEKNLLFIERFGCLGELEKDGAKREFGMNRCNTWVAYDGRVIRDA